MKFKDENKVVYCKNNSYNKEFDNNTFAGDYRYCQYYKGYLVHRKNACSIKFKNGSKQWYFEGKLHRENGPAIERNDGSGIFFINGKEYTEKEYYKIINFKSKCKVLDDI